MIRSPLDLITAAQDAGEVRRALYPPVTTLGERRPDAGGTRSAPFSLACPREDVTRFVISPTLSRPGATELVPDYVQGPSSTATEPRAPPAARLIRRGGGRSRAGSVATLTSRPSRYSHRASAPTIQVPCASVSAPPGSSAGSGSAIGTARSGPASNSIAF